MVAIRLRDDEQFKISARSKEGKRKWSDEHARRAPSDGGSGDGDGGSGGHDAKKQYCLTTICHKFLGAKIFDGQSKPLAGCKGVGTNCRFEHTIPNEPVQAHVLKDLMRAANNININAPEKKKALLAILNAPGFSV